MSLNDWIDDPVGFGSKVPALESDVTEALRDLAIRLLHQLDGDKAGCFEIWAVLNCMILCPLLCLYVNFLKNYIDYWEESFENILLRIRNDISK